MKTIQKINYTMVLLLLVMLQVSTLAQAQTPIGADFTYQGELTFNNQIADGLYDFEIIAFDALDNGNQNGGTLNLTAVEVNDGIFTLVLDFGDAAFVGNEVYLEIYVRENNSGSSFSELSPRQKLTNTPYAIHAQFVGADAVTGDEILNGSITTQDLSNNSITASKIVNNAVGTDAIDSSEVQRRVSQNCNVGSYIRGINEDGTVVCQTDETGNSQVTSAEIVDGTIENIDLAENTITIENMQDNSVGSEEIINNSVGAGEINPSQVQARINGTCEFPEYVTGIAMNGDALCSRLPLGFDTNYADTGEFGAISSIAIGDDGLPVIAYFDGFNENLRFIQCANQSCTSFLAPINLDVSGSIGYVSIAIGDDGNPIVSYYDAITTGLKVVKCTTPNCSSNNFPLVIDSFNDSGHYTKIAIGTDSLPFISYQDYTNRNLKSVKCLTTNCSSHTLPVVLDSIGEVGAELSMTIGNDNLPFIAYYDRTNQALKSIKCINADCTVFNPPTTHDSNGNLGSSTSVAIGSDGMPIISYYDSTNSRLKAIKCTSVICDSFDFPKVLDSNGEVGLHNSIAIGVDNLPIISYWDSTNGDLSFIKCTTITCDNTYPPKKLDSENNVGFLTSMAIGSDNLPIISYWDATSKKLKIYNCGDIDCKR